MQDSLLHINTEVRLRTKILETNNNRIRILQMQDNLLFTNIKVRSLTEVLYLLSNRIRTLQIVKHRLRTNIEVRLHMQDRVKPLSHIIYRHQQAQTQQHQQ